VDKDRCENDASAINDDFSGLGKVHRDLAANVGLDLARAPLWMVGMCDQHARRQDRIHIRHLLPIGDAPMPQHSPDLAALIGSRICHDLISPIGAINNGIELLGMTGAANSPELSLIQESVDNASVRIRFFRLAFGAASQEAVAAKEVRKILHDYSATGKLTITYLPDEDVTRADVRCVFLAQQCVESAMPYGGEISITHSNAGWEITGTCPKFKLDRDLWAILEAQEPPADIPPAHVHFALLAQHARAENRPLQTEIGEEALRIWL